MKLIKQLFCNHEWRVKKMQICNFGPLGEFPEVVIKCRKCGKEKKALGEYHGSD